jgi:hypothetical protein
MLRHLLCEAASALMTRCRQPSKLRAWGVAIARRRGAKRAHVAVARKTGGNHAPHVGFQERVRNRGGQGESGRIRAGFSFTLHDHSLDDGIGRSDKPLVSDLRSETRGSEIGRPTSRIPSRGSSDARP